MDYQLASQLVNVIKYTWEDGTYATPADMTWPQLQELMDKFNLKKDGIYDYIRPDFVCQGLMASEWNLILSINDIERCRAAGYLIL